MAPAMTLTINGQQKELPDGTTVRDAVVQFAKRPDVAVVELNGSVVNRARWIETSLNSGDRVEIVAFVGGG